MRFGSLTVAASASVPARISGSAKLEWSDGVDQVAGQRQLEAAADRHAVDAAITGLFDVAQFLQAGEAADAVVAVDRIAAGRRLEVPAGARRTCRLPS